MQELEKESGEGERAGGGGGRKKEREGGGRERGSARCAFDILARCFRHFLDLKSVFGNIQMNGTGDEREFTDMY